MDIAPLSSIVGQKMLGISQTISSSLNDRSSSNSDLIEAVDQENHERGHDNLGLVAEIDLGSGNFRNQDSESEPIERDPESLLPVPRSRNFLIEFLERFAYQKCFNFKWIFGLSIFCLILVLVGSFLWYSNQTLEVQNMIKEISKNYLKSILRDCFELLHRRHLRKFFSNLPDSFKASLRENVFGLCPDLFSNTTDISFELAEDCLNRN